MDSRLVVGCGPVGRELVDSIRELPGELLVLDPDANTVQRLHEAGVAATQVDITEPGEIRSAAGNPDSVVVAAADPERNLAAAGAAREAVPGALLVAYAGFDSAGALEELEGIADRVIEPTRPTTEFLLERVGDAGIKLRQLRGVLSDADEPLAIVTHDNPDPDAIASAVALGRIASRLGVDSEVCYFGKISHQENRAFVNLLGYDLRQLDPCADVSEFGAIALVDHSRPGVNDQLSGDTAVDIVIDHHPPRAPIDARFVDLRSDVGATSSLLAQYLQGFGAELAEDVATGLLFGLRVDTDDFAREASEADFEAAAYLTPHADIGTLERIESPSVSGDTFETVARAIANRHERGAVLTSYAGEINNRDALAQAADRLLGLGGINATVVYGLREGVVYVSSRARGTDLDMGEVLREAFDQIGSAGGHADMAGAQIPIAETTLDPAADEEGADVETFVAERFFEALEDRPARETTDVCPPTGFADDVGW